MNQSIQKKIGVGIAVIILIMTAIGSLFAYSYAFNNQYSQRQKLDERALDQYVNEVQTTFRDVQMLSQNIAASQEIQNFLADQDHDYFEITDAVQRIKSIINLRVYVNNAVLLQGDQVYWTYSPFEDYMRERLKEPWYIQLENQNETFSAVHACGYPRDSRFITYILKINNPDRYGQEAGRVLLNINVRQFKDILERGVEPDTGYFFVDTRSGEAVLHRGTARSLENLLLEIQKQPQEEQGGTVFYPWEGGYFAWRTLAGSPFGIGIYTSRQQLMQYTEPLRHFFIAYSAATIAAVVLLTCMLVHQFLKPAALISKAMLDFSKGKKTRLDIRTGDEFQVLSRQFNNMADSIEESVKRKIHDEKVNKKLKFDMLMSKIHPHFLYNTLNSVIYLARREGNADIEKMVHSLILILQDGMAAYSGRIDDPLSAELLVVSAYCVIQRYRYKDKFQLVINVPAELQGAYIPKNILQPVVENAIYHGIAPMEEPGTVEILVEREDEMLRICIADSGMGMDEETLSAAKQSIGDTSGGVYSIGMKSIRERLEYLYQDRYTFEIYSEKGKGTTVLICLPYKTTTVLIPAEQTDLYEGE